MYIKSRFIFSALLSIGLLTSCWQREEADNDSAPHFIYAASPAETNVLVTNIVDEGKKETDLQFTVRYGITDDKTATVQATVAPDFSLVAEYNKSKSKNYLPFPEAHLSFPTTQVDIPSGSAEAKVAFKLVNLDQLPNGDFLLPVTIKSATASNGFPLHEKVKTSCYVISNKSAVLKGQWNFEDAASIGKASVGKDLQLIGSGFTQVDGPNGTKAVRVAKGSYFKAFHNFPASMFGEYTLLFDLKYPSEPAGEWFALYQTGLANNEDADLWINGGSGVVGVMHTGYTAEKLAPNVWHRLMVSVKMNAWHKIYFDGRLVHQTVQSNFRFFLEPEALLLFTDAFGYDGEFDIARVDIYEGAMGDARVKTFGGAGN
jgi:hypothetical protein